MNKAPRIAASLAALTLAALTITGCSVPSGDPTANPTGANPTNPAGTDPTGPVRPTDRAPEINVFDAAAILGTFGLVRQIPDELTARTKFIDNLEKTKETPKSPSTDLAVRGNILKDYVVTNDPKDPICFAVSPMEADKKPAQAVWVAYFAPAKTKAGSDLLLMNPGITSCEQAITAASTVNEADYAKLSQESMVRIREAAVALPTRALSAVGLALFDEARGMGGAGTSPSATPTP